MLKVWSEVPGVHSNRPDQTRPDQATNTASTAVPRIPWGRTKNELLPGTPYFANPHVALAYLSWPGFSLSFFAVPNPKESGAKQLISRY